MSLCKEDQIKNPTTNKCVTIKSVTGKKTNVEAKNTPINKNNLNSKPTPLLKNEISKLTQAKIHNFVETWKKNKERKLVNEDYEKFCKTKELKYLKKPIVNVNMTIEFPVAQMDVPVGFSLSTLNTPNQNFVYEKIKGIQIRFNNYSLRHILYKGQNDTVKYFENLLDKTWLKKMNKYISELSTKELYTLVAYTHYGDVIANYFLRNKLTKTIFMNDIDIKAKWFTNYYPLFFQALDKIKKTRNIKTILKDGKDATVEIFPTVSLIGFTLNKNKDFTGPMLVSQLLEKLLNYKNVTAVDQYYSMYLIAKYLDYDEFWQDVIRQYINDLNTIIDKAPPTTRNMIVYRGVKGDYYLKGNKNHIYKTDSFVSTSINLPSALRFAGKKCCFKRITLLPGTKTVLLAGISKYKNEIELLLGSKAQFYIINDKGSIPRSTVDMCNDSASAKITVTDLVVVK